MRVVGLAQGRHVLGTDTLRTMDSVGTVSKNDSSNLLDQRRRPICTKIVASVLVPAVHNGHALRTQNAELGPLSNHLRFCPADKLPGLLDVVPAARVRQKAEVADPHEPIRQYMQQKTPH